jgi:hypothetical protein
VAGKPRDESRNPQPLQSETTLQLRQESLQRPALRRKRYLPPQGLQTHRHPLRQIGKKLSSSRIPGRHHRLVDLMSLDPRRVHNRTRGHNPPSACYRPLQARSTARLRKGGPRRMGTFRTRFDSKLLIRLSLPA